MKDYSKRFQSLPVWWLIQDRLKWAKDGIDGPQNPIEEFREQTLVALIAFKIMTRHPEEIKFRKLAKRNGQRKTRDFSRANSGI